MKAIHKKRLLKLAAYLRKVPKENWDYSEWVGTAPVCKPAKALAGCGTTACALGWGFTMPQMKRAGFKLKVHEDPYEGPQIQLHHERGAFGEAERFYGLTGQGQFDCIFTGAPLYEGLDGDRDGERYGKLLMDDLPLTASAVRVANRIEKFVKVMEKR